MPAKKQVLPRVRGPWERERCTMTIDPAEDVCISVPENETDINAIVSRYARTGILPPNDKQPIYADVSGLQGDLTERLLWAETTVENVHAEIRKQQKSTPPEDFEVPPRPGEQPPDPSPPEQNSENP